MRDAGQVTSRETTGPQFLLDDWDGKLAEDMLDETGDAFTRAYYPEHYLDDYAKALHVGQHDDALYRVEDSWDNYDRVARVLDARFEAWRGG